MKELSQLAVAFSSLPSEHQGVLALIALAMHQSVKKVKQVADTTSLILFLESFSTRRYQTELVYCVFPLLADAMEYLSNDDKLRVLKQFTQCNPPREYGQCFSRCIEAFIGPCLGLEEWDISHHRKIVTQTLPELMEFANIIVNVDSGCFQRHLQGSSSTFPKNPADWRHIRSFDHMSHFVEVVGLLLIPLVHTKLQYGKQIPMQHINLEHKVPSVNFCVTVSSNPDEVYRLSALESIEYAVQTGVTVVPVPFSSVVGFLQLILSLKAESFKWVAREYLQEDAMSMVGQLFDETVKRIQESGLPCEECAGQDMPSAISEVDVVKI